MVRWLLLFLLFAGTQGISREIAVSVYPLAAIAGQLVPQDVPVIHVVPSGADPHHFEPTPSQVRALQHVDIFFGVDDHFDGWIERFLPESCLRVYLKTNEDRDEHIWLSISGGRRIANRMARTLEQQFPEQAGQVEENHARFLESMRKAGDSIHQILTPYAGSGFIQYHPAWDTFAKENGLVITGTLSNGHGRTVSAKQLMQILNQARQTGTRTVVIGLHVQAPVVRTAVRELNGKLVRLDAIGDPAKPDRDSYPELLIMNARLLAEGFHE